VKLLVQVQPRASRSEVAGLHDGRVRVRVTAPPVEGEANEELVRFLARALGVAGSAVRVVAGHQGRRKTVEVSGVEPAEAARRLGLRG